MRDLIYFEIHISSKYPGQFSVVDLFGEIVEDGILWDEAYDIAELCDMETERMEAAAEEAEYWDGVEWTGRGANDPSGRFVRM